MERNGTSEINHYFTEHIAKIRNGKLERNVGDETTILHGTFQIAMYTCSTSLSTSVVEKILRSPKTEKVIIVPPCSKARRRGSVCIIATLTEK